MAAYILRVVALLAVVAGYILAARRFLHVDAAFAPVFALSVVALVAFAGGVAGVLDQVCASIYLGGAACLVAALPWRRASRPPAALRWRDTLPAALFLAMTVADVVIFSNATLGHYDDFSHWGSIVRDMVEAHGFPGPDSRVAAIGLFTDRVPGSATFAYVVCRLIGYSEGHALVAQNMLIAAAAVSVVHVGLRATSGQRTALALVAVLVPLFLANDNGLLQVQTLLVDELMGVLAGAALIICIDGRDRVWPSCLPAIPVLVLVSLLKENGVIYLGIGLMLLAALWVRATWRRRRRNGARLAAAALDLVPPALLALLWAVFDRLWKAHVAATFQSASAGKFSVSATMFESQQLPLGEVVRAVLGQTLFGGLGAVLVTWLLTGLALAVLIWRLRSKGHCAALAWSVAVSLLAIAATLAALVVLYAYVMPASELTASGGLAGIDRYYGATLVMVICLEAHALAALPSAVPEADRDARKRQGRRGRERMRALPGAVAGVVALAMAPGVLGVSQGVGPEHLSLTSLASPRYDSVRAPISSAFDAYRQDLAGDSSVAVWLGPDARPGYRYYLAIYEAGCPVELLEDGDGGTYGDYEDAWDMVEGCGHLIVIGTGGDEFIGSMARSGVRVVSGERCGDGGASLYAVREAGGGVELDLVR